MPDWCWIISLITLGVGSAGALAYWLAVVYYRRKFLEQMIRVFEEKPFFIVPRGRPSDDAEEIRIRTPQGLLLRGCYLRSMGPRRGVILFGLEFGSDRWSALQYCEKLRSAGYDIFAYEPRNQGDSDRDPTYNPLQWVTDRDLADARAAVAYLKSRPDADPRGLGIFGISKGGCIAFLLAAEDPTIRCVVTDGAYDTHITMVPYLRRFVSIYSPYQRIQKYFPDRFYGDVGMGCIRETESRRGVEFQWVAVAARRITVPVLMIHGEGDCYIKPAMAKSLFHCVRTPEKQLWIVPQAKHNQAPLIAPVEYFRRLVDFFDDHLGDIRSPKKNRWPLPVAVDESTPAPPLPTEKIALPAPLSGFVRTVVE